MRSGCRPEVNAATCRQERRAVDSLYPLQSFKQGTCCVTLVSAPNAKNLF